MLPVASFYYHYKNTSDTVNLGDYIQTLAVEAFYDQYFPDAEKITLDRDELAFYSGKPALTIMQGWFSVPGNLDFIPGPNLIPVFIGTHFSLDIRKELVSPSSGFLDRFHNQEIGCRDYSTMNYLRAFGGTAYLSRCLTLTFPRRTDSPEKQKTIFWVDVPDEISSLIPSVFHQNVEVVRQRAIPYQPGRESTFRQKAAELLKKYRDEACCVVTTAIHCAMPCASMGIPVLFLKFSDKNTAIERWSALHGIIPVYTRDDLENGAIPNRIPDPPELEELKKNILRNTYLSCLKAMGQELTPQMTAEAAAARKYIAEFNRTGAPPYDFLRTKDAINTLYELWDLRDTLREIRRSPSYRIGQTITWIPRKINGFFRCINENGWAYTAARIKHKIFRRS